MKFQHEENRIFVNDKNGKTIAFLTWISKEEVAIVDHTFVDESLRGKGVASLLMQEAVKIFRKRGCKTYGLCSYADSWYTKHSDELSDILIARPKDSAVSCKIIY